MKRETSILLTFTLPALLLFIGIHHGNAQSLPIKPTRTISFTTDEGSYMNVDISPDGKTLLFDLLGDLYSLPATGGTATQLTRGIALNLHPVWSPDGKRIAYISDFSGSFHLNVRDLSGKFHIVLGRSDYELSYAQDPVWTPDGHYIAIGDFIYGVTGGKLSPPAGLKNPLRFAADGRSFFYIDADSIYRYDCDNRIRTNISSFPEADNSGAERYNAVSPDGRWGAYTIKSDDSNCLVLRDLIHHTDRLLVAALYKNPSYRPFIRPSRFTFSPDSKNLYIGYDGKIHSIDIESGADRIIPFLAHVKTDLGPYNDNRFPVTHDSVKVRYTRSAHFRPDGRQLVFSTLNKLYVMDLPGGKPHLLAPQSTNQFQPVYSPDGHWIAYVSWSDTAGGQLWRVPSSGGQPEQLTTIPGQYQRPAWTPDGQSIAIVKGAPKLLDRDDEGIGQIQLILVKDGGIRIIADSVPLWNQLNFSRDGSRIIYQPKFKSDHGPLGPLLVSRDRNGSDGRVLAIGNRFPRLQQKSMSPDGRFIVYSAAEDLYLAPVCTVNDPQFINDPRQKLPAIKFAAGVDPYWDRDGKTICWTYANKFYSVNRDKIIKLAEQVIQKMDSSGSAHDNHITALVKPDQVIHLQITAPRSYAHGTIAFTNVRILTMQGDRVIGQGTILIRDGRIVALGPIDAVSIPPGAKILDLPGTTVMPGLVDLHDHIRIPPNVFPQQSWMFLANLAYGVTTACDPALSFDSYGYKELLETGKMLGPRLYTVGNPASVPGGTLRCENIDDARALVNKRALLGSTLIKQYQLPTRLQRQWLLMACREAHLNMTNEGNFDPIVQWGMIKDGSTGIEHNAAWGNVYKDVIALEVGSHTYHTATLQVVTSEMGKEYFKYKFWHQPDPKMLRFIFSDTSQHEPTVNGPESIENIINAHPKDTLHPGFLVASRIDARLRHAGARITLGSHGNDEGIGAHNELWALQMGGLTNMEALQAGTIMGAEALGIQKDLGSIEVGKIADLIILNKNPLDDIHNSREIRYVMKDGILYDGDTLDQLWPVAKKCPEWKYKGPQ